MGEKFVFLIMKRVPRTVHVAVLETITYMFVLFYNGSLMFNDTFDLQGPLLTVTAATPREEIKPIRTSQRFENCVERPGMLF